MIEDYADGKSKDLGEHQDWNSPDLMKLVSETPKFSEVDMKELFWVSRDIIVEQMSGLSLVSTRVRGFSTMLTMLQLIPLGRTSVKTRLLNCPRMIWRSCMT